jgi:hypothetical protein
MTATLNSHHTELDHVEEGKERETTTTTKRNIK